MQEFPNLMTISFAVLAIATWYFAILVAFFELSDRNIENRWIIFWYPFSLFIKGSPHELSKPTKKRFVKIIYLFIFWVSLLFGNMFFANYIAS